MALVEALEGVRHPRRVEGPVLVRDDALDEVAHHLVVAVVGALASDGVQRHSGAPQGHHHPGPRAAGPRVCARWARTSPPPAVGIRHLRVLHPQVVPRRHRDLVPGLPRPGAQFSCADGRLGKGRASDVLYDNSAHHRIARFFLVRPSTFGVPQCSGQDLGFCLQRLEGASGYSRIR